jgi:hypothetical protein
MILGSPYSIGNSSYRSQSIVSKTYKVIFVLCNLNIPKYVGSDKFVK